MKKIEADTLKLNTVGMASQPNGLLSINALKIQLENSLFLEEDDVILEKAWDSQAKKTSNKDLSSILNFKIKAKFSKSYNSKLINYLDDLGSVGLARRVSILTKEGLMK